MEPRLVKAWDLVPISVTAVDAAWPRHLHPAAPVTATCDLDA